VVSAARYLPVANSSVVSLKFIEQFGELERFEEQPSGAEEAAEKLNTGAQLTKSMPQGLKPASILRSLQRD
jgi:hypothetical protein